VSEKNVKKYEIAKIHEFIDNITPRPENNVSYAETKDNVGQKKLFQDPTPTPSPTSLQEFKDNPSESDTVASEIVKTEPIDNSKIDTTGLPEFEPIPEDQVISRQDDDWLSSYDLLEIELPLDTHHGQHDRPQNVSEPLSFEEVPSLGSTPVPERPTETSSSEQGSQPRKNDKREQQRLRRELMQKVKRERHEYLQQEKEARRLRRLEERKRKKDMNL